MKRATRQTMPSLVKITVAAVLFGLVAMTPTTTTVAEANGIHSGSREVFAGAIGPYFARVHSVPFVGTMHTIVYLSESADESQPVAGASIAMWGRAIVGEPLSTGPAMAIASLESASLYTLDLPVEREGQWLFTLSVDGQAGTGEVDIALTITERGSVNLGALGVIAVLAALILLAAFSWGRRRRRRRKQPRNASAQSPQQPELQRQ